MPRKESDTGLRYQCDKCEKSYSRPDHLLRHKLNHDKDKVLECDQCDRTFVRQDLLVRHLERHALRGRTLGRWSGKRDQGESAGSGGDGDGSTSPGPSNTSGSRSYDTTHETGHAYGGPSASGLAPVGYADASTAAAPYPLDVFGNPPNGTQQQRVPWMPSTETAQDASAKYAYAPPPPQQPQHQQQVQTGFYGQAPAAYVQPPPQQQQQHPPQQAQVAFAPRDASAIAPTLLPSRAHATVQAPLFNTAAGPTGPDAYPFAAPPLDHTADYGWLFDGLDPFMDPGAGLGAGDPSALFGDFVPYSGAQQQQQQQQQQDQRRSISRGAGDGGGGGGLPSSVSAGGAAGGPMDEDSAEDTPRHLNRQESSIGDSTHLAEMEFNQAKESNALDDLAFFASLQADIPESPAFAVEASTHVRLVSFLASIPELVTSPLFTPSALRSYLWLYFKHFNTLYPLIHKPTFIASEADSMLLSAMIVIGAHYGDYKSHDLAVRCGSKLWGAYVSLEDFRPARATLPMLQAMVLTVAFGKLMSTRPQHETAHLFHSFVITLARRNACFSTPPQVILVGEPGSAEYWRSWAREEEKKRIALFAFLIDAQHATIFRHAPALSAFQIHLPLCCSEDEWDQGSADKWWAWKKEHGDYKPASFIQSLKATLRPSPGAVSGGTGSGAATPVSPPAVDAFSGFVLLHGMLSVAYDLQWKQNVLLSAEGNEGITNWKEKLSLSFIEWKRRLDAAYPSPSSLTTQAILRASSSLVVMSQLVLNADAIDIQIYAGLPSVLGRFIDVATFSAARRQVKEWARRKDGRLAVWVAANFLRSSLIGDGSIDFLTGSSGGAGGIGSIASGAGGANGAQNGQGGAADKVVADGSARDPSFNREESDTSGVSRVNHGRSDGLDELLHHKWIIYICTLVVWAYGTALAPSPSAALGPPRGSVTVPRASAASSAPLQNPRTAPSSPGPNSRPVPSQPSASWQEATLYLERVSSTPPERIPELEEKFRTKGVLEVVEKELRGSRWELGREAAGVLRKLIRAETIAQSNAIPTPAGTPPPVVKIEGA